MIAALLLHFSISPERSSLETHEELIHKRFEMQEVHVFWNLTYWTSCYFQTNQRKQMHQIHFCFLFFYNHKYTKHPAVLLLLVVTEISLHLCCTFSISSLSASVSVRKVSLLLLFLLLLLLFSWLKHFPRGKSGLKLHPDRSYCLPPQAVSYPQWEEVGLYLYCMETEIALRHTLIKLDSW